MSFNFKRLAWLSCKNIALMSVAIFLTSALIIGTVYVLSMLFGPMGMTIVLPILLMVVIAIVIAVHQMETEEHNRILKNRRKTAEQLLKNPPNTVSSIVAPKQKTQSK